MDKGNAQVLWRFNRNGSSEINEQDLSMLSDNHTTTLFPVNKKNTSKLDWFSFNYLMWNPSFIEWQYIEIMFLRMERVQSWYILQCHEVNSHIIEVVLVLWSFFRIELTNKQNEFDFLQCLKLDGYLFIYLFISRKKTVNFLKHSSHRLFLFLKSRSSNLRNWSQTHFYVFLFLEMLLSMKLESWWMGLVDLTMQNSQMEKALSKSSEEKYSGKRTSLETIKW